MREQESLLVLAQALLQDGAKTVGFADGRIAINQRDS